MSLSRIPFFAVLLVLLLLLIALAAQNYRSTPAAPIAAAAPTARATPTATATPVAPTITPASPQQSCPITRPPDPPFVTPKPWPEKAPSGEFWHGTADLWTALRPDGTWRALPHNPEGYTQKIFLWPYGGPQPKITVSGKRLDAPAQPYVSTGGTNACHPDFGGCVMLTSVDLPSLGCWELTIEHAGHDLSFVVWVAP